MKKILTTLAALVTLFAVVPYALALTKQFQVNTLSGGTLTTGLVSYWNMQGNSNDFFDGNNGTDTAITYSLGNGKVNQGAGFNGTTSNINLGAPTNLNFDRTNPFSGAFWMKTTETVVGVIIGKNGDPGGHTQKGWCIFNASPGLYFQLNGGTSPGANELQVNDQGTHSLNNGVYRFVVVTYDGSSTAAGVKIYIDGSLSGTGADFNNLSASILNAKNAVIGAADGGSNPFTGSLDEVGIWSKVLSAQEVTDLYNGGAGQTMCNGTGGPLCSTPRHHIIIISLNWKPEPIAWV
jgi:hypothetical protein